MKHSIIVLSITLLCAVQYLAAQINLLDPPASALAPSSAQVTAEATADGINVRVTPGNEGYPGVAIKPAAGHVDLSSVGHVEARIANTSEKPISVSLRLDNKGDWQKNPWNTESTYIRPNESGTIRLYFGYAYGHKPNYPLNPAEIVNILLFTGKSDAPVSYRIESLKGAGTPGEKPPVAPQNVRTTPTEGYLFGGPVKFDLATQTATKSAQVALDGSALKVNFTPGKSDASVTLKPAIGRWDLRQCLEVRVALRNTGDAVLPLRLRVDSNQGPTDTANAELAPGEQREVTLSFISAKPWNGDKKSGTQFSSDAASGVTILAAPADAARSLVISAVSAGLPPASALPEWLGKRPPVEGDWVQTFSDDFEGDTIDASRWNIYGENYWDKQSHFSKDNTIIGGGVVRLRFERKHGHQNDDPNHKRVTDYATGFLDTYGKWVQRYGYFEARMKLPTAPGLWPAFWMMPDRGVSAGPQWVRADTGKGGMEFDIMEHLTRWGPYRYNIAMHWDGYGKEHKATGTERIYFQPDADGFMTAGLLWTPGELVYYVNGREVARYTNERVSTVQSDMMFTLPMGGWDNSPLEDAKLPDDFVIDYVRVWQRKDLASAVDGPQAQPQP